ncbi:MAG: hypothetical protein ACRDN6_15620 [Gaiellaceae bacterium]
MATAPAAPTRWPETLYRWLSAPLLITLVGALLINYVIPGITAKSESHKQALEIKTGLVGELSRSVTDAVIRSRFVAGDVIMKESSVKGQQRFYDTGLREWETKRGELQSQIEAYFPRTQLGQDWRDLATVVSDLYTLAASGVPDRDVRVERIRDYVDAHHGARARGEIVRDVLVHDRPRPEERPERDNNFRAVYRTAGDLLLLSGDGFVSGVLDAEVSGL